MNKEFAVSVPLLQSDRFTLREYRREDFELFAEHFGNRESAAHLALADRQTAWRIFSSHAGLWLLHGAGWWAIESRHTGELVGNVGAFFRESSNVMEIGWNTYRAFWGQGIASEAAAAVLSFAFDVRGEPKVQALITPSNISSLRVAARLGLTYEAETEIYGKPTCCYTRERNG